MADLRPRRPRLRLDPDSYRKLRAEVLERDGWRCQTCGRRDRLQVHHICSRSRLGDDTYENLITLDRAGFIAVCRRARLPVFATLFAAA
jgi:5-methylcytosine-specific restriction endonuclease McrA